MKTIIRISSVLASGFCLFAGYWILHHADLSAQGDVLGVGIGFYFVGKAFFVGPMLWITAEKHGPKPAEK